MTTKTIVIFDFVAKKARKVFVATAKAFIKNNGVKVGKNGGTSGRYVFFEKPAGTDFLEFDKKGAIDKGVTEIELVDETVRPNQYSVIKLVEEKKVVTEKVTTEKPVEKVEEVEVKKAAPKAKTTKPKRPPVQK